MPLFVDPQDVILRMQLSAELTGIEEVIASGIIAAQLHVERAIDGKLARRKHNCLFHLDSESFSGIAPGGLYRMEIPSGLVRQDAPQIVETSSGTIEGPFTTYEAIDPGLMKIDYVRGYLYVDAQTYGDYHIRLQCDTGFEDGTSPVPVEGVAAFDPLHQYAVGDLVVYNGTTYRCIAAPVVGTTPDSAVHWQKAVVPMEQVPDAIYEAIMALVPMVFNAQQTTNRSDEAKQQYTTLTDHANLLLQPFMRVSGFTFRAL